MPKLLPLALFIATLALGMASCSDMPVRGTPRDDMGPAGPAGAGPSGGTAAGAGGGAGAGGLIGNQ
jgi:hypothetical protein